MIENTISIDSEAVDNAEIQQEETALQQTEQALSPQGEDMPQEQHPSTEKTIEEDEEMLDLTVYGQEIKLPRSQAIGAAQKGMAFDSMKQKLALAKNDGRLKALDNLANLTGKSVSQLLGDMTSQTLTQKLNERYGAPEAVPAEAFEEMMHQIFETRRSIEQTADSWVLADKRSQLEEFLQHNPGCTDIPDEVIARAKQGENLTLAYTQHQNQRLLKQLAQLEKELERLKSGRAAREKSMPSSRSTATDSNKNSIYGMMRSLW